MSKITLALLLVACTNTTNPPPGNPPPGNPPPPGSTDYVPRIGAWDYSQVTLVTSTSNSSVNNGEAGNFGIDSASATGFHVLPDDGNMAFSCSLSHSAFDCPNRIAQVIDYRPNIDAVLTIHVDANGTFSSATRASGSQDATVDCSGSACSTYGAFPCDFTQDFVISAL